MTWLQLLAIHCFNCKDFFSFSSESVFDYLPRLFLLCRFALLSKVTCECKPKQMKNFKHDATVHSVQFSLNNDEDLRMIPTNWVFGPLGWHNTIREAKLFSTFCCLLRLVRISWNAICRLWLHSNTSFKILQDTLCTNPHHIFIRTVPLIVTHCTQSPERTQMHLLATPWNTLRLISLLHASGEPLQFHRPILQPITLLIGERASVAATCLI